ncbi:MAG: diacylglycerol kinase family lipid kinase [Clostridia bacterium]|nr:diacylglycerol kinase family lipid kinase [Clostridia bacterium]
MGIKKIMLIINPCAGRKSGMKNAEKIVSMLKNQGCECVLYMTGKRGDATQFVIDDGSKYDIVACMGGDGTLNEVINGVLKANLDVPLGYIPAGSTNDFARSMHLSRNIDKAVDNILSGITIDIDTGIFNDRYFCYVSSFGIFTRTSYSTPQRVKNVIGGRLSYMLNSITELGRIKAEHMRVETNGRAYEGDFLFGAVTNSSSVGGVLKYDPRIVNMNDGKLEILLIHKPRNPLQLFSIIRSLVSNKFSDNPLIEFDRSDKFKIYPSARSDWSLDGEFAYTTGSSEIKCLKSKIRLLCPQTVK